MSLNLFVLSNYSMDFWCEPTKFEGNESKATVASQRKTVCSKIFHKATTVVPVTGDGYEILSVINGGKSLKVFQTGCWRDI